MRNITRKLAFVCAIAFAPAMMARQADAGSLMLRTDAVNKVVKAESLDSMLVEVKSKKKRRKRARNLAAGAAALLLLGAAASEADRRRGEDYYEEDYGYVEKDYEPRRRRVVREREIDDDEDDGGGRRASGGSLPSKHLRYCYGKFKSYRESDNTYQPFNSRRRKQCTSRYM